MEFDILDDFRKRISQNSTAMCDKSYNEAVRRNEVLTKPLGSLGRLEEIALWYTGWRCGESSGPKNMRVIIFAGNHGIARHGVSAFPTEVTCQMVSNFRNGGAAINQLANLFGAQLSIYEMNDLKPTKDFTVDEAMTEDECCKALSFGWQQITGEEDLLVIGEMGIGNTTSAAAMSCAIFNGDAEDYTGRGTGVDDTAMQKKISVVKNGILRHHTNDPCDVLKCLGGYEIAAMVGAIAAANKFRIPVILDGFINCAAASVLFAMRKDALDHCVAGHMSGEYGHATVLKQLGKVPLLSLGMRLGEASGGCLSIAIIQAAMRCFDGMYTFEQADVSNRLVE